MDTERIFFSKEISDDRQPWEIAFSQLDDSDLAIAQRFVEIMRHLQEIHQLYQMFKFNLDALINSYVFQSSGNVVQGERQADSEMDHIAINAGVTNLVSAAKTLTGSMDCFMREYYDEGNQVLSAFAQFCSEVYDHSFAYRFLTRLRDYGQHGHILVNQDGFWYGFDLKQILEKPHYHHNATIKKELDAIIAEIIKTYGGYPRITLTMTLAEFVAKLLSVYSRFWVDLRELVEENSAQFRDIILRTPENVWQDKEDIFPEMFIYDYDETLNMTHSVCTCDDALVMLRDYKDEATRVCEEYEEAWNDLKRGMITVRVKDNCIEVGCME